MSRTVRPTRSNSAASTRRALLRGAREMRDGRFGFVTEMATISELHDAFA